MKKKHSFWYRNSLSIVLLIIFFLFLCAQSYTGWRQYNEEMEKDGGLQVEYQEYLTTSHFVEATFENWESEFLQMAMYVVFTVFLRQKGSSESKSLDKKEKVDRMPVPNPDAPWPVRKGGLWLKLYSNSLSIAFFLLFIVSFFIHARASQKVYNKEQLLSGKPAESFGEFLGNSQLWFESFQNWQSEFIAVASIVILSIFFRQFGSPESKPVDAANEETGTS